MIRMFMCFSIVMLLWAYKTYAVYNIKEIGIIEEIKYTLFDDILSDTIGISDGMYKFKKDRKNIIFICTTRNNLEITKHIFIYNKKSKRMKVENIPYFTWGTISYNEEYETLVNDISNKLELDVSDIKINSKLKSLFHKIRKHNRYCGYSIERFEEKIKNKDNKYE